MGAGAACCSGTSWAGAASARAGIDDGAGASVDVDEVGAVVEIGAGFGATLGALAFLLTTFLFGGFLGRSN